MFQKGKCAFLEQVDSLSSSSTLKKSFFWTVKYSFLESENSKNPTISTDEAQFFEETYDVIQ